jgi:alkylhydroperoxidase family enzyme
MPRLPSIDPDSATGSAADVSRPDSKGAGSVPNMARAMANSPALVRGWLGLTGGPTDGVIRAGVRERLAIATAGYNDRAYCLSAHTFIGPKIAEIDSDELDHARRAESADPHSAARLALSDAIVRHQVAVASKDRAAARGAGVSDVEICEVVGHVAANILTNYFNIVADVENEYPVVEPITAERKPPHESTK